MEPNSFACLIWTQYKAQTSISVLSKYFYDRSVVRRVNLKIDTGTQSLLWKYEYLEWCTYHFGIHIEARPAVYRMAIVFLRQVPWSRCVLHLYIYLSSAKINTRRKYLTTNVNCNASESCSRWSQISFDV